MNWQVNFILLLLIVQSFEFNIPQLHAKDNLPSVDISYQNANDNKIGILDVLKKVYLDLKDGADTRQRNFNLPKTYGMSLQDHTGIVWNMLNNASRYYRVGAKGGDILKNINNNEKHPTLQKTRNCQSYDNHDSLSGDQNGNERFKDEKNKHIARKIIKVIDEHKYKPKLKSKLAGLDAKQSPQIVDKNYDISNKEKEAKVQLAYKRKSDPEIEENINDDDEEDYSNIQVQQLSVFQLINDLLEDEEFLDWLADWTEAYTTLLDEHIKTMVDQVVTEQIKEYFNKIDFLLNNNSEVKEMNDEKWNSHVNRIRKGYKDLDPENYGNKEGSQGFVNTQYIRNSSVHNEYITNLYIMASKEERKNKDDIIKGLIDIRGADDKSEENEISKETIAEYEKNNEITESSENE